MEKENPEKVKENTTKLRELYPSRHADYCKRYRDKHPDKVRESQKAYRVKHSDKLKESRKARYDFDSHRYYILYRKYGLTKEQYLSMFNEQGGRCAICEKVETDRYLAVDHCHETGKVRKLLCKDCNTSLGKFNDSPDLLRKAAEYLALYV